MEISVLSPPLLPNIVVALIARTIHGIDTEVALGPRDGLPVACAFSLDNLRTVPKALLTEPITRVNVDRMRALTRATRC
jgi:mRNA interferase MazF